MSELSQIRCVGCEGGILPMTDEEIKVHLPQLTDWKVSSDGKSITRDFKFKNFYLTMSFVNAIAFIANNENHHPDLKIGYNYCCVEFTTHAINGLSKNDFICAAKIDELELV